MEQLQLELFIEKGDRGLWGNLKYKDSLIVSHGRDLAELEHKLKDLLTEFEEVPPGVKVVFEHRYDALPYPEY